MRRRATSAAGVILLAAAAAGSAGPWHATGRRRIGVHQPQVHRGALRDAAPLDDLPVELRGDLADLLLGVQLVDRPGQPFDLLAQPKRGGQEVIRGHAFRRSQSCSQAWAASPTARLGSDLPAPGSSSKTSSLRRLVVCWSIHEVKPRFTGLRLSSLLRFNGPGATGTIRGISDGE